MADRVEQPAQRIVKAWIGIALWQRGGGERGDPQYRGGGQRLERPGYYLAPTVFADVNDEMTIAREEIFGPVLSVLDFEDEADVVARANNTEYGLSAGVFTRDISRAHRVIGKLQAGSCFINSYNDAPVEAPFGGMKLSGIGRENSKNAIEHYSQFKSVYVRMGNVDAPF